MVNANKLKGRIIEKGYNLTSFAEAVCISRPSLRNKISGKSEFKASEIMKISQVLGITTDAVPTYFFAQDVATMET